MSRRNLADLTRTKIRLTSVESRPSDVSKAMRILGMATRMHLWNFVFLGLRDDKLPDDCRLPEAKQ